MEPAPVRRTITLQAKDFVTDKREAMSGWGVVRQLELAPDGRAGKESVFTGFQ